MFPRSEFRSVWEIAHNWSRVAADGDEATGDVAKRIFDMVWAHERERLPLRSNALWAGRGIPAKDVNLLGAFNINRARVRMLAAVKSEKALKALFDRVYVMRPELLQWCEQDFLDPPPLWAPEPVPALSESKPPLGKHRQEEIDRNRCQAIALAYWEIDPRIHPVHMARSLAVMKFGNGAQYRDEETVRGWLAEVDPQKGTRKPGRPPEPNYLFDLKVTR